MNGRGTRLREPSASLVTRALITMIGRVSRLSVGRAWLIIATCFVASTLADYLSEGRFNPFLPYILTTFLTSWCMGERAGLACAFAASVTMTAMNGLNFVVLPGHHSAAILASGWNAFARITAMALFALLASALRTVMEREKWRASVDGLTGALNKDALRERMGPLIDCARATGGAIVLAYMDLDGFKGVNDRHGHSAGDRVLTAFAGGAMDAIRPYDLFARIGGDEFVALLRVRNCGEGEAVAEMLHDRLRGVLRATGFPVSCSIGALIADANSVADDDCLIEAADTLMYEVKRSGKDALRIARGDHLALNLRQAYQPERTNEFDDLLAEIDEPTPVMHRRAA